MKKKNHQVKILIVDDDKTIAEVLKDCISDSGRSVDVCYDGLDAVESIRNNFYDLIIVDLVIPGKGGLEVLKYAKRTNPDVLVIIITGYASLETAIIAIKEGAYDYIRKPFKLAEIKIVVENAIDKTSLMIENRELLKKLQDAYHELMVLKQREDKDEKTTSINLFSTNMPSLHYLYSKSLSPTNYIEKLQALSSFRESGILTENEFKAFKSHLLKMINRKNN